MNKLHLKKAESLAERSYQAHVILDETTDGEPVYVAIVPELPGCIAHGDTVEEALEWLESAKVDHIWFLLDKELEVPQPQILNSTTILSAPEYAAESDASAQPSGGLVAPSVTV